jgi:DNA-binding GntR family transcriptional regulator
VVDVPDLTEQVYGSLRAASHGGTLAPGERLPEVALAQKLGVSRSPVREALRQLATEGLVTMVPGRGATVTQPDPAVIREIFLVRNPLEATAARLAAEQATPDQIAALHEIEAELGAAGARDDMAAVTQLANRFHAEIYAAAGSALLSRILMSMQEALVIYRHSGTGEVVNPRQVHHEHTELLRAIERRDAAAAERAMWAHMRLAEQSWLSAQRLKTSAE